MPVVHFDTVTKQFSPDSYGVKEVSFAIEPGELVFVTGPSGSGKTTLMRLLLKEYSPTQGEIFFNDAPISVIRSSTVHLHRRKIGTVFQDYKLIPELNVWENIAVPLYVMGKPEDAVERRVTDLLNLIKLPHKAELFPSQLSGGEAQRVSIARSLAAGPELIMADEPTGNLDSETAHSIIRLFHKINELGTTILIATHDRGILDTFKDKRRIHLELGELKSDSAQTSKKSEPKSEKAAPKDSESPDEKKKTTVDKKHEAVAPETSKNEESEKSDTTQETDELETKAHSRIPFWKRWFAKKKSSPELDTESPSDAADDTHDADDEDDDDGTPSDETDTVPPATEKDSDETKQTKTAAAENQATPAKSRTNKKEDSKESDTTKKKTKK